jgi:hypothetical protein
VVTKGGDGGTLELVARASTGGFAEAKWWIKLKKLCLQNYRQPMMGKKKKAQIDVQTTAATRSEGERWGMRLSGFF